MELELQIMDCMCSCVLLGVLMTTDWISARLYSCLFIVFWFFFVGGLGQVMLLCVQCDLMKFN
jgi:hypothetical protein